MAMRTPTPDAEEIKLRYGIAKQVLADPVEQIEVPGIGDRGPRKLSRQALAAVIEPRVEELYAFVQQVIRESGYEELLSSGIVITGGTAMLPGMVELGEDVFLKPVRLGLPSYQGHLADVVRNPRHATALGLLEEARLQRQRGLLPCAFLVFFGKNFLLVGNQNSDEVVIFKRDKITGMLTDTGKRILVGKPVCLKFVAVD
jgi:cell division protein FtsA